MGETKTHFAGLDGLRAISALLVVLLHAARNPNFPKNPWLVAVATHGGVGVDVFFAISGFLITSLLLEDERRLGAISVRNFYKRRAFRILPPAYAYLLVLAILSTLNAVPVSGIDLLSAFAFFRNLLRNGSSVTGHFWSLAIEEQFYLVWPIFFVMCRENRRRLVVIGLLLACAPVWRQINIVAFTAPHVNWWRADLRYDLILWGAFFAVLRFETLFPVWRQKYVNMLIFIGAVAAVGISLRVYETTASGIVHVVLVPFQCVAICCGIMAVLGADAGPISGLLDAQLMTALGKRSYSLYLWQQLFFYGPTSEKWAWYVNFAAALACAEISYATVEAIYRKWRRETPVVSTPLNRAT
jgi:peptidoglycan/LPS O-acetylase OafA/YrhL